MINRQEFRLTLVIGLFLSTMLLNGCWNYRSLDSLDIVSGVAVDKNEQTGMYLMTFEIIDTNTTSKDSDLQVKYIEAEGETLFSAIRNAKKKLINKLYGGNMQSLIISKKIAAEEGVLFILEEFLRDGEPRETLSVVISQEETAKDIFQAKGLDSKIISYEIHETIEEDKEVTASTKDVALYEAYNAIEGIGDCLVLPAVRLLVNNDELAAEVDGVALFYQGKLSGFLPAEQTMYLLFITDEVRGGAFSFALEDTPSDQVSSQTVSTEIKKSRTKTDVNYQDGQVIVSVDVKTVMNLMELKKVVDFSQVEARQLLEKRAEEVMEQRISEFFQEIQEQYGTDILGIGKLLYKKDPKLWRSIEHDWNALFTEAQLQVKAKVDVLNTGVLKNY